MPDPMLNFLSSLKDKNPNHAELIDIISDAYIQFSGQTSTFDYTYLRYPPGHYASPIPSKEEVQNLASRIFVRNDGVFPAIELNASKQIELYKNLAQYYSEFPYLTRDSRIMKYSLPNSWFCIEDAFFLYAMIRHYKPTRILEVGSGYSSCVMLDTNKYFMNQQMQLLFVEPYPENRLLHLLSEEDSDYCKVYKCFIQDIDLESFSILEENDILFIDSSHVGKIGSDVLHYFNNIFPYLNKGVIIHLHDIPFPFEYGYDHYMNGGEPWNEMYFLRTFLQYNTAFEILLFPNYIKEIHGSLMQTYTPKCCGGGSFWMRKVS